jgi:hypothetical protein
MGCQHSRGARKRSVWVEQHHLDRGVVDWTAAPSTTGSSRTLRTVAPSDYARHYRTGARCRDGWRSDATGRGACSWHGGVADWLYADDRIVHETKTGRELVTVKWVGAWMGRKLQSQPMEVSCSARRKQRRARKSLRIGSDGA